MKSKTSVYINFLRVLYVMTSISTTASQSYNKKTSNSNNGSVLDNNINSSKKLKISENHTVSLKKFSSKDIQNYCNNRRHILQDMVRLQNTLNTCCLLGNPHSILSRDYFTYKEMKAQVILVQKNDTAYNTNSIDIYFNNKNFEVKDGLLNYSIKYEGHTYYMYFYQDHTPHEDLIYNNYFLIPQETILELRFLKDNLLPEQQLQSLYIHRIKDLPSRLKSQADTILNQMQLENEKYYELDTSFDIRKISIVADLMSGEAKQPIDYIDENQQIIYMHNEEMMSIQRAITYDLTSLLPPLEIVEMNSSAIIKFPSLEDVLITDTTEVVDEDRNLLDAPIRNTADSSLFETIILPTVETAPAAPQPLHISPFTPPHIYIKMPFESFSYIISSKDESDAVVFIFNNLNQHENGVYADRKFTLLLMDKSQLNKHYKKANPQDIFEIKFGCNITYDGKKAWVKVMEDNLSYLGEKTINMTSTHNRKIIKLAQSSFAHMNKSPTPKELKNYFLSIISETFFTSNNLPNLLQNPDVIKECFGLILEEHKKKLKKPALPPVENVVVVPAEVKEEVIASVNVQDTIVNKPEVEEITVAPLVPQENREEEAPIITVQEDHELKEPILFRPIEQIKEPITPVLFKAIEPIKEDMAPVLKEMEDTTPVPLNVVNVEPKIVPITPEITYDPIPSPIKSQKKKQPKRIKMPKIAKIPKHRKSINRGERLVKEEIKSNGEGKLIVVVATASSILYVNGYYSKDD